MKELFTALSKFQSEVKNPDKSSKGVHNAAYAPIEVVWEVARVLLGKHGLSVSHFPISQTIEGKYYIGLRSYLNHASGESISNDFYVPLVVADPQKVGAALTYLKRQSVTAILGITPSDEDLDADNVDTQAVKKAHDIVKQAPSKTDIATDAQIYKIRSLGGTPEKGMNKKAASEMIEKLSKKPLTTDDIPF